MEKQSIANRKRVENLNIKSFKVFFEFVQKVARWDFRLLHALPRTLGRLQPCCRVHYNISYLFKFNVEHFLFVSRCATFIERFSLKFQIKFLANWNWNIGTVMLASANFKINFPRDGRRQLRYALVLTPILKVAEKIGKYFWYFVFF